MTDAEKRQWVRENLPICTAFASTVAGEFGTDVRMVYACEAGHCFGREGAAGVRLADTVVGSMRPGKDRP